MIEHELREQICLIGRLMHNKGYIDATSGNISARLDANHILITPSGVAKWQLTPSDLLIIDLAGNIQGNGNISSEIPMHLACYQNRQDIQGVVHAHPPHAVALTIAGIPVQQFIIPEAIVFLGAIPTLPYATPSTEENSRVVQQFIKQHDVLMLTHHGSLTVAESVWKAYLKLETLEHIAHITSTVIQLGGAKRYLTWAEVEILLAQRQKLGVSQPGEIDVFREFYQVALDLKHVN